MDNPLAFPSPMIPEWSEGANGMTLRDWFAGQALAGLCVEFTDGEYYKHIAVIAYRQADAMLAARGDHMKGEG